MAADSDRGVRERAVSRILLSRRGEEEAERDEVRAFRLPQVNFQADHYEELISWESETVTEPPLTRALSEESLRQICDTPLQVAAYPVAFPGC